MALLDQREPLREPENCRASDCGVSTPDTDHTQIADLLRRSQGDIVSLLLRRAARGPNRTLPPIDPVFRADSVVLGVSAGKVGICGV
jgi:hypothetical protein